MKNLLVLTIMGFLLVAVDANAQAVKSVTDMPVAEPPVSADVFYIVQPAEDPKSRKITYATMLNLFYSVEDDVYGVGWSGDSTHSPSQKAMYDKMELHEASNAVHPTKKFITFDYTNYNNTGTPDGPGSHIPGHMYWNIDDGTLDVMTDLSGVVIQVGQEVMIRVHNSTGVQIDNGKVVRFNGSATGDVPNIILADADEELSSYAIGIVTADIANGTTGFVTCLGKVRDVDTQTPGWSLGDDLWLSQTAGGLTTTKPASPAHAVHLGVVTRVGTNNGIIFTKVTIGHELEELHNVDDTITSGASNNDIMAWNISNSLWEGIQHIGVSDAHHTQTTDTFVTGKDAHDHLGGDGAEIQHSSLGTVGANDHHTPTTDTFVTNKDTHDHSGGDGADIDHDNVTNVTANQHHTPTTDTFVTNKDTHDHAGGDGATVPYTGGGTGQTTAPDDNILIGSGTGWTLKIFPDCANPTTSKLLYNQSTNTLTCGTDQTGAGGGDEVSIDGVSAINPDFVSDGDIDMIRCTGVGTPDASCVSAEDVILRYNAASVDISSDTNLSVSGTLLQLITDQLSIKEGTLTDGKLCTYTTASGLVCDSDDVDTFVTGKDAHDHDGGDGAQIDHANLSNVLTSQHHVKTAVDDTPDDADVTSAPTSNWAFDHDAESGAHHTKTTDTFVTNKDTHDHEGGDGATIPYNGGGTGQTTAPDDNILIGSGTGWVLKIFPDCDNPTASKLLYDQTTNTISCGTDQTGAGGGDEVSIDGVSATNPDFVSDGDVDFIRCTGVGTPDASCVSAEDVLIRYNASSIDISTDTNLSVTGTLLQLIGDQLSLKEGTLTDGKLCTYTTASGLVCTSDDADTFVTGKDAHDHDGGDGAQIDHVNLANKGTTTHTDIDTHVGGSGGDHSEVATNTTHSSGDGSDHGDVASNTTHRGSDGSDHTYLDQSVVSGATPTFTGTNFSAIPDGGLSSGATVVSAGAPDSGKLVKLDANGHVDASAVNDADIDHANLSNVLTSQHHVKTIDTFVTNKDTHDHQGGDGATIPYNGGGTGQTTAPDDNLLVGSGSGWILKVLSECSNPTTAKLLYNATTNVFTCGTDQTGAGGGDEVSIDGVAATNPDFTSDGDVSFIRCTGSGTPDASCVSAEDVIIRYGATSVDLTADVTGLLPHENGGLELDVNGFGGLVAISGGTTSEVNLKSELEAQLGDVSDIAEADGDTYTGTHDFGVADDLEVPNGGAPVVDTPGQVGVDTTADQYVYYGGSEKRVLVPEQTKCGGYVNLKATDDGITLGMINAPITVTGVGVHCDGTCSTPADIDLQDRAGNAMTHGAPTVSTGVGNTTFTSVTAVNSLVAGEGLEFNVANSVSPETDTYTICFTFTYDAQ